MIPSDRSDSSKATPEGLAPQLLTGTIGTGTIGKGTIGKGALAAGVSEAHLSRLMRLAVQGAEDGIVIADALQADLPLIYANDAFERITGYPREEALGRNMRFLQGDQTDQAELDEIRQALRDRRHCRVTLRNFRKDGSPFWNMVVLAPIYDELEHVTHFLGVLSDVTEKRRAETELAYTLSHDTATGLVRVELLLESVQKRIAMSPWDPLCMLFIDIDHFFGINKVLGQTDGDRLLREIATRLRLAAGAEARVARVVSDEFVVAIGRCVPQKALAIAELLRARIAEPFVCNGVRVITSASIGLASYPTNGLKASDLARQAETAMMCAKRRGGNSICTAPPVSTASLEDQHQLGADVCSALDQGAFELHYESRISGADARIIGFEALARWHHPQAGWIAPERFIPVIETLGLMAAFGQWVIHEGCSQLRRWLNTGCDGLLVGINVSAQQLLQPGFADLVIAALDEFAIPPALLELEFSAGLAAVDADCVRESLAPLRALGVGLALDDFGTHLSGQGYLPLFSKMKIDRRIVAGLPDDPTQMAIAMTILGVAHSMHMRVVAEGIETEAQRALMISLGCEELQGHLFGRAVPAAAVFHQLASSS